MIKNKEDYVTRKPYFQFFNLSRKLNRRVLTLFTLFFNESAKRFKTAKRIKGDFLKECNLNIFFKGLKPIFYVLITNPRLKSGVNQRA